MDIDRKTDNLVREYVLNPDSELRFEIEAKNEKVQLELKSGMAELFGTELWQGKTYEFRTGAKIAIFTWQGCVLELRGRPDVVYVSKDTPMVTYLNVHAGLEQMRRRSESEGNHRGPVVLITGPCDVGKSTLSRLLLNYAVRMGRRPIYVDLDLGQGQIGIPGSIGAMLVERPASAEGSFAQLAPLVYHFGHTVPSSNLPFMSIIVSKLAKVVQERMQANKKANSSGVIINTCGWIRGDGYKQILEAAHAFEADVVLVIDQERLYNELQRDLPRYVNVVFLPKSRGVVERSSSNRAENRDARIHDYFYGTPQSPLYPHSFEVKISDVKVYKIGAPILPDSCLPHGVRQDDNKTRLVPVTPGVNLVNHILAVSFASSVEDNVIQTNIAGFLCVTKVDTEKGTMTVLSPQPRPLPDTLLLLSDVQYLDSHT